MKKLLILALFAAVTFCAAAQELTVATYNIRNANRGDAERGNGWERRGPWVCRLIEFHGFDIFGSQEVLDGQLCERMMLYCRLFRSASPIRYWAMGPKPVLMPYITFPCSKSSRKR